MRKILMVGIVIGLILLVSTASADHTKWYETGPSGEISGSLVATRDATAHNGYYELASGNLYNYTYATSPALGEDIKITSGTKINFSGYFDDGDRVNNAYATWKFYKIYGSTATLICQKGDDGTGGVQIPDGGTETITGYCTASSDFTFNLTDKVRLYMKVWAQTIGGGPAESKWATHYWDGSYESWVEYDYIGLPCNNPTISSLTNSTPGIESTEVTWTTNMSTDSRVKYSKNSDLSSHSWSSWDNDTTSVSVYLGGLDSNTKYYYQAWSYNGVNSSCYITEPTSSPYKDFTTAASAGWCDNSWSKSVPIHINNTGSSESLECYPVNINITESEQVSDMESDFGDVRVYKTTDCSLVPYHIIDKVDSSWCNISFNASAVPGLVWTNLTYSLYYKSPSASTTSNMSNTYVYGSDDFNYEGDIDGQGAWVVTAEGSCYATVLDGILTIYRDGSNDICVKHNNVKVPDKFILKTKVRPYNFNSNKRWFEWYAMDYKTHIRFWYERSDYADAARSVNGQGLALTRLGTPAYGVWHYNEIRVDLTGSSATYKYYENDTLISDTLTTTLDGSETTNHVAFQVDGYGGTGNFNIDYFYMYKFTDVEPSTSFGTEADKPAADTYIPPDPVTLTNTTGNFWVNYTWDAGTGNVTNGYNVTWNASWYNTSNDYMNKSVGAGNWANISVWAWNSSGDGTISSGSISDQIKAAVGDTSFTVTLPVGYTFGKFTPDNSTDTNVSAEGQNSTTPFYNVTNTGNVDFDVKMNLNETVPTITAKLDTDNNPDGAHELNTTLLTVYSSLPQGNSVDIWLWSDFDHTPAQLVNRTVNITSV